MNKKKIELQVLNLSDSQAQAGAYALVLKEIAGNRQLPIIIGAFEAQAILISMKGIEPPRPLTHTLFSTCLDILNVRLLRVLIYRVENGVFYSYIYLKNEETLIRMDARTSDAVTLAIRMSAPIYTYEHIMEEEYLRITDKESLSPPSGTATPQHPTSDANPTTDKASLDTLKAALEKAVKDEDYERAALLRDRIAQQNL